MTSQRLPSKYHKHIHLCIALVSISIAVIEHYDQRHLKSLFHLTACMSIIQTSEGRNLEAETDPEALEKATHWLVHHGFLSLLSYSTQPHMPRAGTTLSELSLPHINHQSRKSPADLPARQSYEGIFPN